MRRQVRMMAAAAAAVSLMMAVPGQAAEIGDFLTGGSGGQSGGCSLLRSRSQAGD